VAGQRTLHRLRVAFPEPSAPLHVGEEVGQGRVGGHIAHATDGGSAGYAITAAISDQLNTNRSADQSQGRSPCAPAPIYAALTLATALRVDSDIFLVYDTRLLAAPRSVGLSVQSPS
jgi:hypothetical protein